MNTALHALLHPIRSLWQHWSAASWRRLPRPVDDPVAHTPGSDADRLLLVGSGIAVGYGVLSHELGLAGHLARRLSSLTGRGVFVDVISDPDLGLADVSDLLDEAQLARCDALLLTLGGAEAATLASPIKWRRGLEEVLDSIDALAFTGLHVFVVGVPMLSLIPGAFGSIARPRAVLLNEQSALIEAPGGERVGAFCLIDSRPRAFSASDLTLLRELALQAQSILVNHRQVVNPG